ncbi:hypothetical protein LOKO_01367 [Halomonas chromatireducens]|uniref:Uncharacterized protein n=1 Tax=Halomonas chromatireducens TaxID=507626 RepID=A0A0X8HD35_9GAMM|nr:hypothetical protein LOKO_01367 [Halomonas chromatireducens]
MLKESARHQPTRVVSNIRPAGCVPVRQVVGGGV